MTGRPRVHIPTIPSPISTPLALDSGIYGANSEVMPKLHRDDGDSLTLRTIGTIASIMLAWIRVRGWFR